MSCPQFQHLKNIELKDIDFANEEEKKKFCLIFAGRVIASFESKNEAEEAQKGKFQNLQTILYVPKSSNKAIEDENTELHKKSIIDEILAALPPPNGAFERTIFMLNNGKCELFDPTVID